jgi:hypothetical protein
LDREVLVVEMETIEAVLIQPVVEAERRRLVGLQQQTIKEESAGKASRMRILE